MTRRSRAREVALQVLFGEDLNPRTNFALSEALIARRLSSPELADFARSLVKGVRLHRQSLDEAIQQAAENWSLARMAATDRNVLRIGAYELLFSDTPPRVAIDEAIELAKRYGTSQSAQFVNGILDRIVREKKGL